MFTGAVNQCWKVPAGGAGSPPLGAGSSHAGAELLGEESGCVHIMGLECPFSSQGDVF